jgi:nucleotide-binding universal stress UspA family protein
VSPQHFGLGRVLCALDVEHDEWGPLAIASEVSEHFRVPLEALYAAKSGEWENRTERVRRLIAEHTARERLEQLVAPLTTAIEVNASVQRGAAKDIILKHAGEIRAGLIVLGSADRRSFGKGSHRLATAVAGAAAAAVLTMPSETRSCSVRRILFPVTTAAAARPALKWVLELARRFGASVTLVPMASPATWFGAGSSGLVRSREAQSRRATLLERSLERLRLADVAVSQEPEQRDASGLSRLVSEQAFDLVTLGIPASPSEDFEQLTLAERLRQCSLVPVLSARARAQASSQFARAVWSNSEPGYAA